MKREIKCVVKQRFGHRSLATQQIIDNYVNNRSAYGLYECPNCLDFHLTSNYDNRSKELKRKCLDTLLGVKLPRTVHLVSVRRKDMKDLLSPSSPLLQDKV